MRKLFLSFCTIFCAALVAISIILMSRVPRESVDNDIQPTYIVKEYGGKIAVFVPQDDEPLAVYEVYVHLLPENDIELLRKGISVDDDFSLQKTLEDFGL